jgi:hypothetical protein
MEQGAIVKSFVFGALAGAATLGLAFSGLTHPALASPRSGVSVTSSGDKFLNATTHGPSNKAYYTFMIKDPKGLARTYESCMYDVFSDEWSSCKTHRLQKGAWVKPTADGWIITGYLWYRKPFSPAGCDSVNYNWPKYKQDIEVYDREGQSLARDWHGVTVRCSG